MPTQVIAHTADDWRANKACLACKPLARVPVRLCVIGSSW